MKIFSKFFKIIYLKRILYKIINKLFLNKLGNQFYWNPPYDYVQNITINNLFNYIDLPREEVKEWCIVGVHFGKEIESILKNYQNVNVVGFECSERYIKKLEKKFYFNKRVKIINKAVSSSNGKANFYETSLNGNGSLLKIGELSRKSYNSSQKENFSVETITIDTFYKNKNLDILWIDVQGAEKLVLEGAVNTLKKIKAVFIEISIKRELYVNSATMKELDLILIRDGFKLVLLGTDFNLTGNALYIK